MQIGVFIPIGNNGWLISENSPQYMGTWELNRNVVQEAERQGFAFALSMIKLRGFGGKTEFWDHALESFTLMAGLAACTERIKLYASTAVLTLPPAVVARMATTSKDANAAEGGTAKTINLPDGAVNFTMATLVGSYETVARQIDQVATMKGVEGMM